MLTVRSKGLLLNLSQVWASVSYVFVALDFFIQAFFVTLSDRMETGHDPKALLNWLSSYDHGSAHHRLLCQRAEGTGMWILQNTQLSQWWESTSASIWCSGIRMYPSAFHLSRILTNNVTLSGSRKDNIDVRNALFPLVAPLLTSG